MEVSRRSRETKTREGKKGLIAKLSEMWVGREEGEKGVEQCA